MLLEANLPKRLRKQVVSTIVYVVNIAQLRVKNTKLPISYGMEGQPQSNTSRYLEANVI